MTTPSYELVNGEYRVAIPEPFWLPGWRHSWRTIFRWVPSCYPCRKSFSTRQEYEEHYLKMHYTEVSG